MKKKQIKKTNAAQRGYIVAAAVVVIGLLGLGGWYFSRGTGGCNPSGKMPDNVQMPHIHGLGFSADGCQLFIPAHEGLVVFAKDHWLVPDVPVNDYMGYSPADNGFYSSGHPGAGSPHINPLGLVKSTDGGQTFTTLGFEGESDFHLMSVGYKNHAIYVFSPLPNSKLSAGMHYSLDDGKTWIQSQLQGIEGDPFSLAVHPIDSKMIALATEKGLFLSADSGQTFTRIATDAPISAVSFEPDGKAILFGYKTLSSYDLATKQSSALTTPAISGDDALLHIAVNPISKELAFATFGKNIYLSKGNRQSWAQIAQQGIGKN